MRSVYAVGLLVGIAFTVLASTRPSVAVVIYPWAQITADAADMENKAPDHIVDVVGKELENGHPGLLIGLAPRRASPKFD
jgi:hypothetical protein